MRRLSLTAVAASLMALSACASMTAGGADFIAGREAAAPKQASDAYYTKAAAAVDARIEEHSAA